MVTTTSSTVDTTKSRHEQVSPGVGAGDGASLGIGVGAGEGAEKVGVLALMRTACKTANSQGDCRAYAVQEIVKSSEPWRADFMCAVAAVLHNTEDVGAPAPQVSPISLSAKLIAE